MLLWLVSAVGFLVCVIAWHIKQGITLSEAVGLFIATSIAFSCQLDYLYTKNTTDYQLISGYVTSLVYRPSYEYRSGKSTATEPEHWIIEQSNHEPSQVVDVVRPYIGKKGGLTEKCHGECLVNYPQGEPPEKVWKIAQASWGGGIYLLDVRQSKWENTDIGEPSVIKEAYFNPILHSDEVIYGETSKTIPDFTLSNVNKANRFLGLWSHEATSEKIEKLNASLSSMTNISVGLIVTTDSMRFEELKRSWKRGKANDFIVVVYTPDGKSIKNVNVMAWGNYNLIENIRQKVASLPTAEDTETMVKTIGDTIRNGPIFVPRNFDNLKFLQVKIPESDYMFVLSYQVILVLYLLALLNMDPNTKDEKANWNDVFETWQKHGNPSSGSYYLHPFSSTGLIFYYTTVPFFFFKFWEILFPG